MLKFCKTIATAGLASDMCGDKAQTDAVPAMAKKFIDHLEAQGLSYGTVEEFDFRYNLFIEHEMLITKENAKATSHKLAHNMFSTMTDDEKKAMQAKFKTSKAQIKKI